MLIYKCWSTGCDYDIENPKRDYDGWFLFGVIPIYIRHLTQT